MRTLIVSDLHLGCASRADVLRTSESRALLLEAVRDADRLVLLGDVLELREAPVEAMAVARPFFEDVGRALCGRELVVVPGNHDHALIAPWLARRRELDRIEQLGAEQLLAAEQVSPLLARIARWAAPARLTVAYPGLWVREDVYAIHGHYLDCHLTTASVERLAIAARARALRRDVASLRSVEDYEALTAPVYAWMDALVARALLRQALPIVRPLAAIALRLAGIDTLRVRLRGDELRRAECSAMGRVAATLGLGDAHVVFGHTHRRGPLRAEDARAWQLADGARLVNCGCWLGDAPTLVSAPVRSHRGWPCAIVRDSGPPTVELLGAPRSATLQTVAERQ